jgi:hypothetical protein
VESKVLTPLFFLAGGASALGALGVFN